MYSRKKPKKQMRLIQREIASTQREMAHTYKTENQETWDTEILCCGVISGKNEASWQDMKEFMIFDTCKTKY